MREGNERVDGIIEFITSAAKLIIAVGVAYTAALWFALIVWTYRDIEQRSRSVVTQIFATLLVVLFFVPGAILYYVLRPRETLDEAFQRSLEEEYLLQDLEDLPRCHSCHRAIESDWIVCPACHTELRHECPNCSHLVRVTWDICPYCATEIEPAARSGGDEGNSIGRLMASLRDRIPTRMGGGGDANANVPGQMAPPAAAIIPMQQVRPLPPAQPLPLPHLQPPMSGNGNGSGNAPTDAPIPFRPATPPQQPPRTGTEMFAAPPAAPAPGNDLYRGNLPVDFDELRSFRIEANGNGNGNGSSGNGNGHASGAANGANGMKPFIPNGLGVGPMNGNSNGNGTSNGNGANGHAPASPMPMPLPPRREGENTPPTQAASARPTEPAGPPRRP